MCSMTRARAASFIPEGESDANALAAGSTRACRMRRGAARRPPFTTCPASAGPRLRLQGVSSDEALVQHRVGDLEEARDVGACHVVALDAVSIGGFDALPVDGLHDAVQARVHFFARPAETQAVLAHLEARGGHAAGVGGLAGTVEDALLDEDVDALGDGRHVGAFGDHVHAVVQEVLRILGVDLVLHRAREGALGLVVPQRVEVLGLVDGRVDGALELVGVLADAAALDVLEIEQEGVLLAIDAGLVVDVAGGVAAGDGLAAEVEDLLDRVLGDVAGAADEARLALERLAPGGEHLGGEVHGAVAGRLGTDQRAAPVEALAGEHADELVAHALVLAEHEADRTAAHADVAGGHVGELADVAAQLGHERLAELHDLEVALALGVEVRAILAAAHGERRQGVLEDLLESEELEEAEVDGRMEAQAALVGADGAVHLDAEAAVDLDLALVVHPRDAEHDHALRLGDALEDLRVAILRVLGDDGLERLGDFHRGLVELRLAGVLGLQLGHVFVNECAHVVPSTWRYGLGG